jgi:two-component system, cell cycle response regulator
MNSDQPELSSKKTGWMANISTFGQTILVADDDPISRTILVNFLMKKGIKVLTASNGIEALELVENHPQEISLMLVDWMMPALDGISVISSIRSDDKNPFLYCILITAKDSKSDIVKGFEAGTDDYITKPFDRNELWARILTGLRIRQLLVELSDKNRTLAELALKDSLTGLLNRRAVEQLLKAEISRASRFQKPMSLAIIDIDHFKRVNDTYGHPVGDKALQAVAATIQKSIRQMDVAGRLGGEEFVIVFPETNTTGCQIVAERIRRSIEMMNFKQGEDKIHITISLGLASGIPLDPAADCKKFLELADQAVYQAKANGRNCWVARDYPLKEK